MSDLIRRSDVIEALKDNMVEMGGDDFSEMGVHSDDVDAVINGIPTIEPKRGEWIDMGDFEQCSVCKGTRLKEFQSYYGKTTWIKTPYCPNCGADMREREGE